jgi:hypothetical protein
MANRVTVAEVKEILETSLTDPQILAFIGAANVTITALLGSSTLTTSQLKEIERFYAAHMIACTRDQQAKSESAGDASITYQGETGKDLDATFYGQQIKLLDTTGIMAAKAGRRAASVYAVTSFKND